MTHERFDVHSGFALLASIFRDVIDLAQKELALAKAEMAEKLAAAARAAILVTIAACLALVACVLFAWGLVYALAASGLALYWAFFIVAAGAALIAGTLLAIARRRDGLTPHRTIAQIRKDIGAIMERWR